MSNAKITFLALSGLGIVGSLSNAWSGEATLRSLGLASVSTFLSDVFSLWGIIEFFLYPTFVAAIIGGIVWLVSWLKKKKSRGNI